MNEVEILDDLTLEEAKQVTIAIQNRLDDLKDLLSKAYLGRAWKALGYKDWHAYCKAEFPIKLKLPKDERGTFVRALQADTGMSTRAIASATGNSQSQIDRDIRSTDPNGSVGESQDKEPVEIKGVNGKTYKTTTKTHEVVEVLDRPGKLTPESKPSGHGQRYTVRQIVQGDIDRITGALERLDAEEAADVALNLEEFQEWVVALSKARDDLTRYIRQFKGKIVKK